MGDDIETSTSAEDMPRIMSETLEDRGSRYGPFNENARITWSLMRVIETAPSYGKLTDTHKEAFHMIFHKIARAVCGDPNYEDNPHDIAGYAQRLEEFLCTMKNDTKV